MSKTRYIVSSEGNIRPFKNEKDLIKKNPVDIYVEKQLKDLKESGYFDNNT